MFPFAMKVLKPQSQVFIAGDVTGIEEASAAMVEGHLAGLEAAASWALDRPITTMSARIASNS